MIACHGQMAQGVVSALKIIIGERENISYLNAYVEGTELAKDIRRYFDELPTGDEVIILTDLYGGSVNQELFSYGQRSNVQLVSGFNLALVLELALSDPGQPLTEEDIEESIALCSKQMKRVKKTVSDQGDKDDFDFLKEG